MLSEKSKTLIISKRLIIYEASLLYPTAQKNFDVKSVSLLQLAVCRKDLTRQPGNCFPYKGLLSRLVLPLYLGG